MNPYIGRSREWLEEALLRAQEDHQAGKSIESSRAGEIGKTEHHEKSVDERIEAIYRALNRFDPVAYPIEQITRDTIQRVVIS